MNRADLLALFKFYREEEKNPFIGKDAMKAKWWDGEKTFLETCVGDPLFFDKVKSLLEEAYGKGEVNGYLADKENPTGKRVLVFYLDLWNGKYHPYDSLDDIFEYIRA